MFMLKRKLGDAARNQSYDISVINYIQVRVRRDNDIIRVECQPRYSNINLTEGE